MTTRVMQARTYKILGFVVATLLAGGLAGWQTTTLLAAKRPLWLLHRSITVGADVPMRADLTMTRRRHGQTLTTQAHVVQGSKGRCRVEYVLPVEARGRIVISDGQTNWQYEPRQNLLARTMLLPENEQNERDTEDLITQNYRLALLSNEETVGRRGAYLLELLPRLPGKSSQRRWIDKQTYKTLRTETHYPDGILARMVAYEHVVLPAPVAASDFQPLPSPTLRHIDSPATSEILQTRNLIAYAEPLGLKTLGALGFRLTQIASSPLDENKTAHLLYSDGIESVSVFVQKGGSPVSAKAPGWHAIRIDNQAAFENLDGHLDAIVWTRNSYRYTAVSHLGPHALQQFVGYQMTGGK